MGTRQKFSLKKYNKDRTKCYELSKSGINFGMLENTEERISSKRIKTVVIQIQSAEDKRLTIQRLKDEAEHCIRKDVLGLCTLPTKDRKGEICKYCEVNV